jgi:excisionase family DNA binding protein
MTELLDKYRKKLPTPDAADYLGLGKSTLDKLRVRGGGPAYYKVGSRIVYDVSDLDDWLAQHRRNNTSASPAHAGA